MRWFAGVAIAYVALMLLAVGGIQFLSHAGRTFAYQLRGPTGVDYLRVYRDAPIPAIFGGRGGAPGEVEAVDLAGRVLDSEHVPNIDTVSVVDWAAATPVARSDKEQMRMRRIGLCLFILSPKK